MDTADFSSAVFNDSANFQHTRFGGFASFYAVSFNGAKSFHLSQLPESLDFRYVRNSEGEIDLSSATPPKSGNKCMIALYGTDLKQVRLNMDKFELWFPPEIVADTNTVSDTLQLSYDNRLSVFEQLLLRFREIGYNESYIKLDIEYRKLKYSHGGFVSWYFVDTWQRLLWYYRYRPVYVFVWTIGVWIVASLIALKQYQRLLTEVYAVPFLLKREYISSGLRRGVDRFVHALSYTAVIYFGLKLSPEKFYPNVVRKHPWLFAYVVSIYVIGLVFLGYIANLIFT